VKNRADPAAEQAALDFAHEQPAYGQLRVSNELRKRGAFVSPSGARSIWLRHDLATGARMPGTRGESAPSRAAFLLRSGAFSARGISGRADSGNDTRGVEAARKGSGTIPVDPLKKTEVSRQKSQ